MARGQWQQEAKQKVADAEKEIAKLERELKAERAEANTMRAELDRLRALRKAAMEYAARFLGEIDPNG